MKDKSDPSVCEHPFWYYAYYVTYWKCNKCGAILRIDRDG